jgi:hypothetical protein
MPLDGWPSSGATTPNERTINTLLRTTPPSLYLVHFVTDKVNLLTKNTLQIRSVHEHFTKILRYYILLLLLCTRPSKKPPQHVCAFYNMYSYHKCERISTVDLQSTNYYSCHGRIFIAGRPIARVLC